MNTGGPVFLLLLGASLGVVNAEVGEGERLYLEEIRPLLADKCLACHGGRPEKIKGEFDLRTREGLLKGGESGRPGLLPGRPEESPVFIAVTWRDPDLEMPPKKNDRLAANQIASLRRWIELGAPWVEGDAPTPGGREGTVTVETSGGTTAAWTNRRYRPQDLWAYHPVRTPQVPRRRAWWRPKLPRGYRLPASRPAARTPADPARRTRAA